MMKFLATLDRRTLFAVLALVLAGYLPTVIGDAMTYHDMITGQHTCCGFVSESWIERPITYAMVDEWTTPSWQENASRTERFLTSDGMVNGQTKFWRLLERQPLAGALE